VVNETVRPVTRRAIAIPGVTKNSGLKSAKSSGGKFESSLVVGENGAADRCLNCARIAASLPARNEPLATAGRGVDRLANGVP
jgi:hypothetical protein